MFLFWSRQPTIRQTITVNLWYRAIKNKKIEKAVINTLRLATRKNLIQMLSDVITIVTAIINYCLLKFVNTIQKIFIMQCYFRNGE
jgi:hypothetical protein